MPRWRKVRLGKVGDDPTWYMPGGGDLEELALGVLLLVGAVVVAVILIPLLLFGVELIALGFLIAASILGRSLLGRPWVIRASPVNDGGGEALSWRVVGWRRSGRLIDEVATALAAGTTPPPAS